MAKKYSVTIWIILIAVTLYFGGRWFVFKKIKDGIDEKIAALDRQGVHVKYSSLDVNSLTGSILVQSLTLITEPPDSVCGSSASVGSVEIKGISLLPVLLSKELKIGTVAIKNPVIHFKRERKEKKEGSSQGKLPIKSLIIGKIEIDSAQIENVDSVSCKVGFRANFNLFVDDIEIKNVGSDSLSWQTGNFHIDEIGIELPTKFYNLTINQISYYKNNNALQLDSLLLTPSVDKNDFAKLSRKQIDQFTCLVPSLHVNGFDQARMGKHDFTAHHIALGFTLEVYRDKRFPRMPRKPTILPIDFIHHLPYQLHIDSLTLDNSFISYQERPEKGNESGRIFFDKLKLGVYNISTDTIGETKMKVYSRFMDGGDLNASFTFPLEKKKNYSVKGSLTGFSMPKINGMLGPIAHIKIESGDIQAMNFNFQYNRERSDGSLEMRYQDLKVIAIRAEDQSVNKLATLVINALVKTKMDKNDPKDKRTGTIDWTRDEQKSILNLWWKSILSGIKSVFGFDKFSGKADKNDKNGGKK